MDWENKKSSEHPDGYVAVDPKTEFPKIFTDENLAKK
jgi:hypothetical protein